MIGKLISTAKVKQKMCTFHSINFDLSFFIAVPMHIMQKNIAVLSAPPSLKMSSSKVFFRPESTEKFIFWHS